MNKLYDEIAQAEAREAAAREKWEQIRQQKLSGEKVYDFLTLYGIIYQEMTDAQKWEFMHCFIKRVEVYPEKQPDGRILKSIEFNFPVWLGEDFCASAFPAEKVTPETVCCLYHQKRDFISVPYEPKDAEYLNFLFLLSKVLNSRDDYKMDWC